MAYMLSRCVYTVARLGVADHLAQGPRASEELARVTGADHRSLHRMLRALVAYGIFARTPDGQFAQNGTSHLLLSNSPDSVRELVIYSGMDWQIRTWHELPECIRTGRPVFEAVLGATFFDYFAAAPCEAAAFNDALGRIAEGFARAVLAAYDFGPFSRMVDVGGGTGTLLLMVLQAHPHLIGELVDRAQVVREAAPRVRSAGLAERCKLVPGDFFQGVPAGADVYVLKHVLHDWDDEKAAAILRNCAEAVPAHGKLLVIETILQEDDGQPVEKLMDLAMMLQTGGAERSEPAYAALCKQAGLRIERVIPTRSPCSVLEIARASPGAS
jgi:hypothetical protein